MKKSLLLLPLILLLAAGCNKNAETGNGQNKQTLSVDSTVNDLKGSVDVEQSLQTQSDLDVINSDQETIINASNGVTNENNY